MWARAGTTLRSMALMVGAFSSVTYTCIESADVYRTWLWVWVLIYWRMHAFELQNFWDKAAEGKTVPWNSPFSCFCQDVENVRAHINLFVSDQIVKEQWLTEIHVPMLDKSLSLFPNQILVYVTAFAAYYLFLFWNLHLLSSLSKKKKKKMWEDI